MVIVRDKPERISERRFEQRRDRNYLAPKIGSKDHVQELEMMKVESKAIEEKSVVESKSDSKLVEEKPKIDEVVGEKPTVERASAPESAEGSSGKDNNNNAFPKSKHVNRNPITGEGMPSLAPGQRRVPRKDGNPLLGTGYNSKRVRDW